MEFEIEYQRGRKRKRRKTIVTGILSAYYYCYADTVEEAAELLLSNAQPNMGLMEKASQGRIVRFLQKH